VSFNGTNAALGGDSSKSTILALYKTRYLPLCNDGGGSDIGLSKHHAFSTPPTQLELHHQAIQWK